MQTIDLHMHTRFSDGSDDLPGLLENLGKAGIKTFSVTDHDTCEGALLMEKMVPEDMTYYRGIEFSCTTPAGLLHVLGYNYRPDSAEFHEAIAEGRRLRDKKLELRLDHIRKEHSVVFNSEELDWLHSLNSVGKPHISTLLVKRGLAANISDAIKRFIDDQGGDESNIRITAEMAVSAVLAAGGIPVWAHPLGGEGEPHLTGDEFEARLSHLLDCGIKGMECYYSRFNREEEQFLLEKAQKHGLFVSGGSDYHGKNKTIPLGRVNAEEETVPENRFTVLDAFR